MQTERRTMSKIEVKQYYSEIHAASQATFAVSLSQCTHLGYVHDLALSLQDWHKVIPVNNKSMLQNTVEQVEVSCLSMLGGIYRQAFAGLRLSLEMLFGMVYFSAHELEYIEWTKGTRDISWSIINDEHNGVFSCRFANAFFPELASYIPDARNRAARLYRELSEYVHGNYSTWSHEQPALEKRDDLIASYERNVREFRYLAQLVLSIRYLKQIHLSDTHVVEIHVTDELGTLPEIRSVYGGPVEIC